MRLLDFILPAFTGGVVSGVLLLAEHYVLDRSKLRRPDAYILGVLTLDVGYLIFLLLAGQPVSLLAAFFTVQAVGGVLVKGAYRIDRKDPPPPPNDGQLQETLNLNERLREEIARLEKEKARLEEEAKSSPLKDYDLTDIAALAHTAIMEAERAVGVAKTVHQRTVELQDRNRMALYGGSAARARAAKAEKRKAPETFQGKS